MAEEASPADQPVSAERPHLTVAIASDLHAFSGERNPAPSHLNADKRGSDPMQDPIAGLKELIDREAISADLLLCPGDLGDRARRAAVIYGWEMIQRLASALGGAEVMATVGNHDVSSRPSDDEVEADPIETLRALDPRFPFNDRQTQQAYLGDNYAIVSSSVYRVVMLNSSAYHARGEGEYDFGRITPETRARLLGDLTDEGAHELNILLCHHHPIEYTPVDEPDRSSIVGGTLLLRELNCADLGPWVVIHGHKHLPNLAYAPGSGSSPVVFSAGSLSASFHLDQQAITRNQFYLLEFDPDAARRNHSRIACRFTSWYWVPKRGWLPTTPGSGLPAKGGFGTRCDPRAVAHRISNALQASSQPSFNWHELLAACPEVEFLIPDDLEGVQQELGRIDIGVEVDENGRFEEVAARWLSTGP